MTTLGDIAVLVANEDVMPARVTRPRYMYCVKRCEVDTRSVFDTGPVRLLRALLSWESTVTELCAPGVTVSSVPPNNFAALATPTLARTLALRRSTSIR